jgi:hypothetical protein
MPDHGSRQRSTVVLLAVQQEPDQAGTQQAQTAPLPVCAAILRQAAVDKCWAWLPRPSGFQASHAGLTTITVPIDDAPFGGVVYSSLCDRL